MILSQQQLFSDKQAVTSTALSTNVLDLKAAGIPFGAKAKLNADMGKGTPIELHVGVAEDVTASGSATVTITLEVSDNEDMSSSDVILTTAAIAKADLVKGWKLPVNKIPLGATKQYMAVRYTVGTGPLTAGKFNAFLPMSDDQPW